MSWFSNLFTFDRFLFPWAFLALFFLLIAYFFALKKRRAILHGDIQVLRKLPKSLKQQLRTPVLFLLWTTFLLTLTIGAARPVKVTDLPDRQLARNLMLVLDISRSMEARDFGGSYGTVSRLKAVKSVVREFISARQGDRIGLVAFGSRAFLQSPLTMDHSIVEELVEGLSVGVAGDGTAIGDGLGLGVKRIEEIEGESKAIILLTDGVSNAGKVQPLKAASVAKELGVKVHTIGIGQRDGRIFRQRGFGRRVAVPVEFDEKTLQQIAKQTGGVYFHAESLEGLKGVYRQIDKLERSDREELGLQRIEELFPFYATLALCFFLLNVLLESTVFRKVPVL